MKSMRLLGLRLPIGLLGILWGSIAVAFPCERGTVDGLLDNTPGTSFLCENGASGDSNDWNNGSWSFFGLTGWEQLQKQDVNDNGSLGSLDTKTNIGLAVTSASDRKSGTWSFGSFDWADWDYIAIVIKDGGANLPVGSETFFSAYKVISPAASGDWFMCNPNTTGVNQNCTISHLSVYGIPDGNSGNDPSVPEPTTLALLGLGLAGLAVANRRKA